MQGNRSRWCRLRATSALVVLAATLLALPQTGASAAVDKRVSPSGAAIPSLDGWRLKFGDNFTGGSVDSHAWSLYDGGSGSPKAASNVKVHDGMVTLQVAKHGNAWSGAGMCGCRVTTGTYGTYLLRVRYDHGLGAHAYALMWPTHGWPPEVDFMEYDARDSTHHLLMLTNHYSSANLMQHAFIPGDYRKWHTIGLEWTPTELRYTLDGRTTEVMKGHVPHQPMWVGIANSLGNQVRPGATTPNPVDLDIDWFAYYVRS